MIFAIAIYLIGVFCLACVDMFLICLGAGCHLDEGVKMFLVTVLWPIALPYYCIKFLWKFFRVGA